VTREEILDALASRIVDATGYHRRDAELTILEAEAVTMATARESALLG
jgi:hypothetical protein